MRLILVPTADRPESALALGTAFDLAADLGSSVAGCHVRGARFEPVSGDLQLMPDAVLGKVVSATPTGAFTSRAAKRVYVRTAREHSFQVAKRPRIGRSRQAFWHELVGTPARMFAIAGPLADLVVVARPKPHSAGRARAFLLAALLHSARPVLVLPQKSLATVGEKILIAWNQSAEAALVVASSIPLLKRAKQVIVVSSGPENRAGPKSTHLEQYLATWDIKIERMQTRGRHVEQELERVYRETGSDLLVMGAYSRPRFRQLIFGGVTEHMLFRTALPALMLHR